MHSISIHELKKIIAEEVGRLSEAAAPERAAAVRDAALKLHGGLDVFMELNKQLNNPEAQELIDSIDQASRKLRRMMENLVGGNAPPKPPRPPPRQAK